MRLLLLLAVILYIPTSLASDSQLQIEKAMYEYSNYNKSSALKRLKIIVDEEPENYKARWLLLHYTVLDLKTMDMRLISEAYKDVLEIVILAKENGDFAYAHYVLSLYARNHRAYETALKEINEALNIEPDSILYNITKAALLVKTGSWRKDNDTIREGISYYEKANEIAGTSRPVYFSKLDYHFDVAWSLGSLKGTESCPIEAIDHYLAVTRLGNETNNTKVSYAWNNVSCAYRASGQCEKAVEASKNALKLSKYGAAKTNLKYSEFCMKMQKMDLWTDLVEEP